MSISHSLRGTRLEALAVLNLNKLALAVCVEALEVADLNTWRASVVAAHAREDVEVAVIAEEVLVQILRLVTFVDDRLIPEHCLWVHDDADILASTLEGERSATLGELWRPTELAVVVRLRIVVVVTIR